MLRSVVLVILIKSASAFEEFPYLNMENNFHKYYNLNTGIIFKGRNGKVAHEKDKLVLECFDRYQINRAIEPLKDMVTPKEVWIEECMTLLKPIMEQLQELNINGSAMEMLVISVYHKDMLAEANYTTGLNLKTLWIHTPFVRGRDFLMLNPEFMNPLTNLTTLILWGGKLPPLPQQTQIQYLSLRHNVIVPTWDGYCRALKQLSIHDLVMAEMPTVWPKNCSHLDALKLEGLTSAAAHRIILSGINSSCVNLKSLYIQSCNISSLPLVLLNVAKDLRRLNLNNNRLLDSDLTDFPLLPNLTDMDLGSNKLTGSSLAEMVKQIPSLQYLNLDGNNYINFCNFETRLVKTSFPKLERLSLKGAVMDPHCLQNTTAFPKLTYLDLGSSEKIDTLLLYKLPSTDAGHLTVDLRNRVVGEIFYSGADYRYVAQGNLTYFWRNTNLQNVNLTILMDPIDCDCKHYWLARMLREFPNTFSFPGLMCNNTGAKITEEPFEKMYCSSKREQYGCIIRDYGPVDNYTAYIDCHNPEKENDKYPYFTRAYSLNFSNNHIETLKKFRIVDSVEIIDLRRNRILYLDKNDTNQLFANPRRKVWLSQNLFVCDCEKSSMIDSFYRHKDQIVDYEEITCVNYGIPMYVVTTFEVCQYGLRIAILTSAILVLLILSAIFILWRYKLQVKIFLYSRGWCLFFLSEDNIDADRPYDAFLSFTHADEKYVTEELLPLLEGAPNNYSVCVHFRDWEFGGWIPEQIMRSVRLSKRTLIVLSRNFVQSLWGSLEFRYAVASLVEENRSRLLVLILDDVLSDSLSPELQGYLSYNTYLHCEDPWFWEKLRYAMPRQNPLFEKKSVPKTSSQEEIVMNSVLSNFTDLKT